MVISPEIRAKFELQSSYTRKEGWNIFYDAIVPYNIPLTAEIFQLKRLKLNLRKRGRLFRFSKVYSDIKHNTTF